MSIQNYVLSKLRLLVSFKPFNGNLKYCTQFSIIAFFLCSSSHLSKLLGFIPLRKLGEAD